MITCSDCNKPYNEKMATCPYCGCSDKASSVAPSQCPRCKYSYLDSTEEDGIYSCTSCEGMWVSEQSFQKATSLKKVINDPLIDGVYKKPKFQDDPGYLPCAQCGKLMARENFKQISGVHIDKCMNHGIWLDSGELQSIQSFIASGGIDRAQDKKLTSHSDELTKLRMQMSDVKHDIKQVKRRQFLNFILSMLK
ncbi:MAG: zf-TFIIB domain-containing protein [Fibrobacterales bacterium]